MYQWNLPLEWSWQTTWLCDLVDKGFGSAALLGHKCDYQLRVQRASIGRDGHILRSHGYTASVYII